MSDPAPAQTQDPGDKTLTIGRVCEELQAEFPSVSISKIRFLEDQRLVTPQRSPGGYRKYSQRDVERLRTILRLQRDEFLPLRVIRQELETSTTGSFSVANQARQLKRANLTEPAPTLRVDADDLVESTGAPRSLVQALQQFGLIGDGDATSYNETDRETVQTALELADSGSSPGTYACSASLRNARRDSLSRCSQQAFAPRTPSDAVKRCRNSRTWLRLHPTCAI